MITAGLTNSFKYQLLLGQHDFSVDTIKIALYTVSADMGPATTVYTTTNEVTGTGYTAGGVTATNVTVTLSNGVAFVDFDDPTWAGATFTTQGALIYNASKSNKSVGLLNFGQNRTPSRLSYRSSRPSDLVFLGGIDQVCRAVFGLSDFHFARLIRRPWIHRRQSQLTPKLFYKYLNRALSRQSVERPERLQCSASSRLG